MKWIFNITFEMKPFYNISDMFRKTLLLLFTLSIFQFAFSSTETEKLINTLEGEISNRENYISIKTERIHQLTAQYYLSKNTEPLINQFENCLVLLNEYKSFSYDSAFKYVGILNQIAYQSGNIDLINSSKIKFGFTLLSSGLFKEALDTLNNIRSNTLNKQLKPEFYNVIARTLYDLADYNADDFYSDIYRKKGTQYLDSALALIPQNTWNYWTAMGLRRMKADDYEGAADAFNFLITQFDLPEHPYAIATSSLGYLYSLFGRENEAIDILIKAAIADIQTSTKETVALRNLAVHLFNKGDIKRAYRYIKIALDDATIYNARHRKIEVGAVLPIIEGERLSTVEKQRKQLLTFTFILSMLSVMVISFFTIIYYQNKRLNSVKLALQATNQSLNEINLSLREANKIKQEYIGYFFSVNSEYIDKIEAFYKKLHRKIVSRQFNDLDSIINNTDLKKERQMLFDNFDRIFLKIFPHFIDEFNKLFHPNDQIIPEKEELLNTDLRIFALIRLGINDNDKIAKFLNYSVNTIYTYKTKIKNKTIVDRDEFDKKIMEIRSI